MDELTQYYSPYTKAYTNLLEKRIVFLAGEINRELASNLVATFFSLEDKSPGEPIKFYINSEGGEVVGGLFPIYDAMQAITSPVHTICIGEASSSAAILLAAGSKGYRTATANSRLMIHQIQVGEGSSGGRSSDLEIEARETKSLNKQMIEILARHCGQTYRKVYRDCENDKWFSAQEAKDYGIIDIILEPKKPIPELRTRKRPTRKGD